jgi:hypothetical protein
LSNLPQNRHSERSACGAESKNLGGAYLTDAVQAFSTTEAKEQDLLAYALEGHGRNSIGLPENSPNKLIDVRKLDSEPLLDQGRVDRVCGCVTKHWRQNLSSQDQQIFRGAQCHPLLLGSRCHGGKATSRFRLHVERRKALLRIERSKEDAQGYEPYVPINDEDTDISVIAVWSPNTVYGFRVPRKRDRYFPRARLGQRKLPIIRL